MNDKKLSRRDFLIAAGCGCAGLALASSGCSKLAGVTASAALICPYGYRYDPWPGQCYRYVDSNGSGYCDLSEPVTASAATAVPATGSAASPAAAPATPGAQSTTAAGGGSAASAKLIILCDRGCSYPGHCGRYMDANGTGRCDLSEGIPADQAANFAGAGAPGGRGRRGG